MKKAMRIGAALGIVVALSGALGACGDDDTSSSTEETGRIELTPVDDSDAVGEKPIVEIPDGEPPSDLLIEDIREGQGAQAGQGSFITVHYVGVSWSTGEQFDASWDRDSPFQLTLGVDPLIEGWTIGLQGMKVGGQRRLTIPPEFGYGEAGIDGVIAPSETLVFIVDLLAVE